MKQLLFIVILLGIHCEEEIIKKINKNVSGKERKELTIELKEVFNKVKAVYNEDFNKEDTLYIIRGLDLQNRHAIGRVWNNEIEIHYVDEKLKNNGNILKSNPEISMTENFTSNFDDLIGDIERGDKGKIVKFSDENKVLSGIYWKIMSFKKNYSGKYESKLYDISDFAVIKKE